MMEEAIQFTCNDKKLYGILHIPDTKPNPSTVVLIITGGPQVRTGAHRLYVQLSRFLCKNNWASFRFDYEGLGDSEGEFCGFRYAQSSIDAAVVFLQKKFKHKLNVVLWSLCDGATAAMLYGAWYPARIGGMILCNPYVMTEKGLARSTLKHYYSGRLISAEFLNKLIRFEVDLKSSIKSLFGYLRGIIYRTNQNSGYLDNLKKELPDSFFESLCTFNKPIIFILSTNDIVASNFQDELNKNKRVKRYYKNNKYIKHIINGADHTFVDPSVKNELFKITLRAINKIECEPTEKVSF